MLRFFISGPQVGSRESSSATSARKAQQPVHLGDKIGNIEGLGEKIISAASLRSIAIRALRMNGQHHDRHVALLADTAAHFPAVHNRHTSVKNHGVWLMQQSSLERLKSIFRQNDLMAFIFQNLMNHHPNRSVIFGD